MNAAQRNPCAMPETMPATRTIWPEKTHELHNHHLDSTVWNDFAFRDDDVVIGTYAKSGTTWTQQIVGQLVFQGAEDVDARDLALARPADAAGEVKLPAAQTHRRFMKTHLPVDALVFSPKAKYLYVARDGRDVVWSMYNHHSNANAPVRALNNTPGGSAPPIAPPPGHP